MSQRPIIRNAASLFGSTVITSLLGFVFWFVAAKLLSQAAVGTASAIQSAAQFLSTVCIIGLGTLTLAELAESKAGARRLISASSIVTGTSGLLAGIALVLVLRAVTPNLRPGLDGYARLAIVAGLSCVSTVGLLLDDACVGLLRGDVQLRRNVVFAASKLALLPVVIYLWKARGGSEVAFAWFLGVLLSLIYVPAPLRRATPAGSWRPDFRRLWERRRLIYSHHWLNISIIAPRQLLPVIVAAIAGPAANAGFYAASLVVTFVNIVPVHLSTALFALRPGDEVALRKEVRGTMRICIVLSLLSGPFFLVTSRFILELFRHSYVSAAPAMVILGFTTFPSAIKSHYVAISRVRNQMRTAAVRTTIGAIVEIGLAASGAHVHGVTGVAVGLLVAYCLEAIVLGATVVGVLREPRYERST